MNAKSFLKVMVLMAFSLIQLSCSVFGVHTEERPKYQILESDDHKELRSYEPYVIAKTSVKGQFREAQSQAFRILAGYIFGGNEKKQSIAMTAPVVQSESSASEKITMTAPVIQSRADGGWQMAFMMPSKYKISDLPVPNDKRIQFEEVPAKLMAAIDYSGRGTQSTNMEKAEQLKNWIVAHSQYDIVSEPKYAGFDPPWTIPLFRRNEMMFEVRKKSK